MSLKLAASVAAPFDFISRHDTAINLPPMPELDGPPPVRAADESDDDYKRRAQAYWAPIVEWERPLRLARDTGDYGPILRPDVPPMRIKLRSLTASQWAKLERHVDGLGDSEARQLVFRAAVVGLSGDVPPALLDTSLAPTVDKTYADLGPIRPEAFVDMFTGREEVIAEIATFVTGRRHAPGN